MKSNRILIVIVCVTFIILFSFFRKPIRQNIKFDAVFYKWDSSNHINQLLIKTTLSNNSSDTFTYVVMSCYYPFFYNMYPDILNQFAGGCNKNIPELVRILPHKSLEVIVSVPIEKTPGQLQGTTCRMGIALISVNNIKDVLNDNQLVMMTHINLDIPILKDTNYIIKSNFFILDKKRKVNYFDTLSNVSVIWSGEIKL